MSIVADLQVPAQVQVADGVFRSRWGYHPCDKATFLEIKEFHRYVLKDLRATRQWERWHAKLPGNRKGKEPACLNIYPACLGGSSPRLYSYTDYYLYWVLTPYQNVRHPAHTPESVKPFAMPPEWRLRLATLREFYGPLKK